MSRDALLLTPLLYPDAVGGMEVFNAELARWLAGRGGRTVVVTRSAGFECPGAEIVRPREGGSPRLAWLAAVRRGIRLCSSGEACALLPFARTGWLGWLLQFEVLRISGVPYLLHVHGGGLHPWRPERPFQLLFGGAERVLSVSKEQADEYRLRAGRWVEVVPPTIPFRRSELDRDEARRSLGIPVEGVCAVTVGSLGHMKGTDVLLDAWELLARAEGPVPRLCMFGRDREDVLSARDLPPGAEWMGPVPLERVRDVMRAADVFMLPSRREGTPLALLEAAWNGLPPVLPDIPALEAWRDGHECLRFRAGDPASLAAAAARLCAPDADDLRRTLGPGAASLAAREYPPEASFLRLEELLRGAGGAG